MDNPSLTLAEFVVKHSYPGELIRDVAADCILKGASDQERMSGEQVLEALRLLREGGR